MGEFILKNKRIFLVMASVIGICVLFIGFNQEMQTTSLQQELAKKVIRFHVVADNDTSEAQEFKLKVRDETLTYLKTLINGEEDIETTRKIIYDNLKSIEENARKVALEEDCDYTINAYLGRAYFPIKEYGSVVFPAGYYETLNINIGKAEGKNWWCVMYPNLCFVEGTYAIIDETTKEEIKKILTEEEYKMLMDGSKTKVKFKSIEWIKDIMKKVQGERT